MADILELWVNGLKNRPATSRYMSPADELGPATGSLYVDREASPDAPPMGASAFPPIPLAGNGPIVGPIPREIDMKTAAELQGRKPGEVPKQFEEINDKRREELKGTFSEYDERINEMFGVRAKPDFSDLKADMNAEDTYTQKDYLQGALLATLPTVIGGLFGGLAGAAGASKGGEVGAQMFVKDKADKTERKRKNAKEEAARRLKLYEEEGQAARGRAQILISRMQAEIMATGKLSDASRELGKFVFGLDSKQGYDAQVGEVKAQQAQDRITLDTQKAEAQRVAQMEGLTQKWEIAQEQLKLQREKMELSDAQFKAKQEELARQFDEKEKRISQEFNDKLKAQAEELAKKLEAQGALQAEKLASQERLHGDKLSAMEKEYGAKIASAEKLAREAMASREKIADKGNQTKVDISKSKGGGGAAKPPKPPTASQSAAAGYARRLQQSMEVLNKLETDGYFRSDVTESAKTWIPEFARGKAKEWLGIDTDNLQAQEQAERNFINAVLRRESGAAISPTEFDSAEKQYFPRPNDSANVLAQKKANREQVFNNFRTEAAHAFDATPYVSPTSSMKKTPEQLKAEAKAKAARMRQP